VRPRHVRAVPLLLASLLVTGCGTASGSSSDDGPPRDEALWSPVAQAPLSARHHPVVVAVGERFLVLGGVSGEPCPPNASCTDDSPPLADGASYDPVHDRWTKVADAPAGVSSLDALSPAVVGDTVYLSSRDGLLGYDSAGDSWRRVAGPPRPWTYLTSTGKRLVAFDYAAGRRSRAFVLDAGTWRRLPDDPLGTVSDRWLVAVDGGLLVAGHSAVPDDRPPLVKVAFLRGDLSTWGPARTLDVVGWAPTAVAGRVVWGSTQTVDGGTTDGWGRAYPEGAILDPGSGHLTALPEPPRSSGGLTRQADTGHLADVGGHLLDPVTRSWTRVPEPPDGSRDGAGWAGGRDTILMWGGAPRGDEAEGSVDTGYLLDPTPAFQ